MREANHHDLNKFFAAPRKLSTELPLHFSPSGVAEERHVVEEQVSYVNVGAGMGNETGGRWTDKHLRSHVSTF